MESEWLQVIVHCDLLASVGDMLLKTIKNKIMMMIWQLRVYCLHVRWLHIIVPCDHLDLVQCFVAEKVKK